MVALIMRNPRPCVSVIPQFDGLGFAMTYDSTRPYPRDLVGYGQHAPQAQWPGQARIALQFVLNYEEGGENATLHGDAGSEIFLSESKVSTSSAAMLPIYIPSFNTEK
jgi:hypothetical protein